jgi:hypothetical protein
MVAVRTACVGEATDGCSGFQVTPKGYAGVWRLASILNDGRKRPRCISGPGVVLCACGCSAESSNELDDVSA